MEKNPLTWLADKLLTLSMIPVFVMTLHVTADVLSKFLFNRPINGTLEISSYYYMVSIVLLPLAFIELNRLAIAVDAVFLLLPKAVRVTLTALVLVGTGLTFGLLSVISWFSAVRSYEQNEKILGLVEVLIWPPRFLLPVTLMLTAIICLYCVLALALSPATRERLSSASAEIDPDRMID